MGDDRHQHGRFGWTQLLTTAPAEAAAFYQALLGWQVRSGDLEGVEQHLLLQDGEPVASILGVPGDAAEALPHWHPHLNVDDVDQRVALACDLGGRTVVEPGDIPGFGRLAVIQDPTGAVLTLVGPLAAPDQEQDQAQAQITDTDAGANPARAAGDADTAAANGPLDPAPVAQAPAEDADDAAPPPTDERDH